VLAAEQQICLGLARSLDAGPKIFRVGGPQIREIRGDGMGVDIDEASLGGQLNVDGGGSAE
jgi:hypothetical protein